MSRAEHPAGSNLRDPRAIKAGAELAERTTKAQGKPLHITDPAVLADLALIFADARRLHRTESEAS